MAFFGLRSWPTPVLKPMAPFIVAGGITLYVIAGLQTSMLKSPTYANDPRNPYAKGVKPSH